MELAKKHLAPHHQMEKVKYFTAKLNPRPSDPDQPVRQATYLRAILSLGNVEVIYGHFLSKIMRMTVANPLPGQPTTVEVIKTEEKGSDVNLASHMLHDAHLGLYECAVVISGDSDLLEPVRLVMSELHLPVGVLNPQKHPCAVLKKQATFYKHLRPNLISSAQLPHTLTDNHGTFHKPIVW